MICFVQNYFEKEEYAINDDDYDDMLQTFLRIQGSEILEIVTTFVKIIYGSGIRGTRLDDDEEPKNSNLIPLFTAIIEIWIVAICLSWHFVHSSCRRNL